MPISPIEVIEIAAMMTIPSEPYRRGRPGAAVSKLPPEMRDTLKKLTSRDTMSMRLCFPPGGDIDPSVRLHGRNVVCDQRMRSEIEAILRGEEKLRSRSHA